MITEKEALEIFEKELFDEVNALEQLRLKKKKQIENWLIAQIVLMLLFAIIFLSPSIIEGNTFALSSLIPLAFAIIYGFQKFLKRNALDTLRYSYKYKLVKPIIASMFESFQYIPYQRIAKSVLEKSKLFETEIVDADGEDFIRFEIDGVKIMLCETVVLQNTIWASIFPSRKLFAGVFISATFNKNFQAETFVLSKKTHSFLNRLKRTLFDKYEEVELESIQFHNEFNVLSSNQVEARFILSPSLMQRILDYKNKVGENISISFVRNRMYFAIPNPTDLFEPKIDRAIKGEDVIQEIYKPIKLFTDIVEDLNLNLRIWK